MSRQILLQHRKRWHQKAVVRTLYTEWYEKIAAVVGPGRTLEIGGGTGNFKSFFPRTVTSDIVCLPWLDLVSDAHSLPFRDDCLGNIVLFDVLHHLETPILFFDEALRVLKNGGRIIMMEPYLSLASFLLYRFIHPEGLDLSRNPFETTKKSQSRKPFDANQAIPTLLFIRRIKQFEKKYPQLNILNLERFSFFAYPLSGGFDKPSLIPLFAVGPLLLLERFLSILSPILAFRMFIVIEKT